MKQLKTEQRNPRTRGLDLKSALGIVRALNQEDATVARAVRRELPAIARAVDAVVASMQQGGTLFYVGAGTSGRLAVLDAAEIPPTFGISRKWVRALIAGGRRALENAVEGAEDSAANGAKDLRQAGLKKGDVVVGIAASGTTPYVLGALAAAEKAGATTVGVTSNRKSPLAHAAKISIAPNTGQEAVAGSTRLKAGTSQKMVLNLLSTAVMVRLGRVYENWMIHLSLTNQKLERRATRILREATGASASTAAHTLRQTAHDLPAAIVMLKSGVNASDAKNELTRQRGNARLAIESLSKAQHHKSSKGKSHGSVSNSRRP